MNLTRYHHLDEGHEQKDHDEEMIHYASSLQIVIIRIVTTRSKDGWSTMVLKVDGIGLDHWVLKVNITTLGADNMKNTILVEKKMIALEWKILTGIRPLLYCRNNGPFPVHLLFTQIRFITASQSVSGYKLGRYAKKFPFSGSFEKNHRQFNSDFYLFSCLDSSVPTLGNSEWFKIVEDRAVQEIYRSWWLTSSPSWILTILAPCRLSLHPTLAKKSVKIVISGSFSLFKLCCTSGFTWELCNVTLSRIRKGFQQIWLVPYFTKQ